MGARDRAWSPTARLVQAMARRLLVHAVAQLHPTQREWGTALLTELDQISAPVEALRWALGGRRAVRLQTSQLIGAPLLPTGIHRWLTATWLVVLAVTGWGVGSQTRHVVWCAGSPLQRGCDAGALGIVLLGGWVVATVLGGGVGLLVARLAAMRSAKQLSLVRAGSGAALTVAVLTIAAATGLIVVQNLLHGDANLLISLATAGYASVMLLLPWAALTFLLALLHGGLGLRREALLE